jgi:hypothetical protein
MVTFALVSEGVTDQIVIEKIIDEICSDNFDGSVEVNPLQPLRDATDRTIAPHGGWELVFEYCENRLEDALAVNDFVVIHLDTDQGDHVKFGLHLTNAGKPRPFDELIVDTTKIIAGKLGNQLYDSYADRLIFAIAVHSIESWLLLCLFDRNEPMNSLDRLNRQLRKSDRSVLTKDARSYTRIARDIKRKQLLNFGGEESSLGIFVVRLAALKQQTE